VRNLSLGCNHSTDWQEIPTVSILILNWQGEQYLKLCLQSLLPDLCPHVEVLVVDNGSRNGSLNIVSKEYPWVRLVAHKTNLGFSRGYNAAVPYAKGHILVFLNNDVVCRRGWLDPLIEPLLKNEKIGITTCKVLLSGSPLLNCAGGYLKLWTGGGEIGFGYPEDLFNEYSEPFYAPGVVMAIRRDLFEKIGGFDNDIFAYCEDLDLCWRARLRGYKILYVPKAVVYHSYSASWGTLSPRKFEMVTRHYIRVMIKCLSWSYLFHSLPAYILFSLTKAAILTILTRENRYFLKIFTAFREILCDFANLMAQRQATQRTRRLRDKELLKSAGFGYLESPRHYWNVYRLLRQRNKQHSLKCVDFCHVNVHD
jgi:GT2 family glycosyltransferase